MEASHVLILGTFVVYLILLLGIGIFADRKYGSSYSGFLAANKSLGAWVTAISAAASSESAWVMLGLSGLGYTKGFAAYWASIGCVLGFIFTALFVVVQLRRESEKVGALTVSDYIERKLNDRAKVLRVISAILIFFFMMVYVIAQFVGSGKQMAGMHLMSYDYGVIMGAVIIGIYVVIGGYAAVCFTDLIQGLLMALVMIAFPIIAVVLAINSPDFSVANINGFFDIKSSVSWGAFGFILGQLGIGLGYFGMPHSIVRFITVKNDHEARKAALITVIWSVVVLFGSATLGIFGKVLLPNLADPETVLPVFTTKFFHPVIAGVVLASITAAIMSTADSQLMLAATSLVHDLFYRLRKKEHDNTDERKKVVMVRVIIGVMALVAMILALVKTQVIYTFVLFAWGALGSAFSPIILLSLYSKKFNRWGALTSLIAGPVVVIFWKVLKFDKFLYEMIPGFFISLILAWVVSVFTQEKS